MEHQTPNDQTTSLDEQRGGGGKLRKQPNRRSTTSTPYTRPHPIETPRRRWLSKLIDPAYRLISGGANYILPSFFSKSEPALNQDDENHCDELESENYDTNNAVGKTVGLDSSTSKSAENLKGIVDVGDGNDVRKEAKKFSRDGVDEIEKLIEEKNFSRDDIIRLLEIIRSRAADDCNVGLEKKSSALIAQDVGTALVSVECGKKYEQNPEDSNRGNHGILKLQENKYSNPLLGNIEESAVMLGTLRKPSEPELGYSSRATWETSTPLFKSTQRNDVGSSPIDIAKAYMENRTLELGSSSKRFISKDEGVLQQDDGLPSKPLIPLPSPKPSICWPGSMVHDQRSYKTPLSRRGRSVLQNFPRSPYSRTIGSKSRSKLQGDSDRHLSTTPSHLAQSLTSPYGQVGTRANVLDSGRGSVGPIRRIERKVSDTPRGFAYFQSPVNNLEESISAFEKGKTSSSSKLWSVQNKAQISDFSVPTVPSHSSDVARKILEHLERNPPTPKEKSAEIKLATSRRKPQSSYETTSKTLGSLDSIRESEGAFQQNNLKDNGGYSVFKASQEEANKVPASASNNSLTSGMKFGFSSSSHSHQTVPSLHSSKSQDSQQRLSTHEDVSNAANDAAGSELLGLRKKPPSSGTKPILPAISITKPGQRLAFPMDNNNSGFTFPISASSTVSSEPPTPSIMPSSTAAAGDLQDGNPTPLYNFGSKRSTPAIVFSFPSTSNAPTSNDSSDLKFNFGSEKSNRISFASVGKDSICY